MPNIDFMKRLENISWLLHHDKAPAPNLLYFALWISDQKQHNVPTSILTRHGSVWLSLFPNMERTLKDIKKPSPKELKAISKLEAEKCFGCCEKNWHKSIIFKTGLFDPTTRISNTLIILSKKWKFLLFLKTPRTYKLGVRENIFLCLNWVPKFYSIAAKINNSCENDC